MSFQNRENLAYATVAVAPSPAASGTTLTVANGLGSLFPLSNFTITVYPPNVVPLASNAEICLVSSRTGDVFTIVRAQEGTSAKNIATGWQVANTVTKIAFTDIQNQMIQFVSAGSTKASASEVVFSNANGVSFGISGQTVTASISVTGGGGGGTGVAISAGAGSQSDGQVVFSNSNGISFGLTNSVLTASHDGITSQSVQTQGMVSVNGSTGAIVFSNSNNVTFGGAGSIITASASFAQSTQPVAASASNGSFTFSTLGFSNANNVTFGTSAGGIITASIATAAAGNSVNFSGGTSSANLGSIVFSNSNGVSFGLDGATMTASVAAGGAAGSISAGTTNVALGEVVFSNSNNITFGLNGSTLTASASNAQTTQPVAASASNGSFLFSTLAFSNANNVTFGTSAGSIITASVATAAAGNSVNFSAGTTSNNLGSIVFSNSNGISFGLDGGTITASAASGGGGGGATLKTYIYPNGIFINKSLALVNSNGSMIAVPVPCNISFSNFAVVFSNSCQQVANNSIAAVNFSASMVLFTNNAGTLSAFFSTSNTNQITWSTNFGIGNGAFEYTMGAATSLSAGNYWMAFVMQTTNTGGALATITNSTQLNATVSLYGPPAAVYGSGIIKDMPAGSTYVTRGWVPGMGVFTNPGNLTAMNLSELTLNGQGQASAFIGLRFQA